MNSLEQTIAHFWNTHPCGHAQVEGPADGDYENFFNRYDAFRYQDEPHILRRLNAIDFRGKRVLEIGLGQGAESEQLIRRGAVWSGIDLTQESVDRVARRLALRGLGSQSIACGSVLNLPFAAETFDMVFSHGVLHHVRNIERAQSEIARVLKPHGELIAMLYARRSLNYLVSIALIRRLALAAVYSSGMKPEGIIGEHVRNASQIGLLRYVRMRQFIHANTDGPLNPYSKVYDLETIRTDFPDFSIERSFQDHMHAPPLPVRWLKPLAGVMGWHLWVYLRKKHVAEGWLKQAA